jgi:hypothetical protein
MLLTYFNDLNDSIVFSLSVIVSMIDIEIKKKGRSTPLITLHRTSKN